MQKGEKGAEIPPFSGKISGIFRPPAPIFPAIFFHHA